MGLDIFSYAVLKNTIKNSGGGWPSDLPRPSLGGYGYTTTEVLNETELICKRPEADTFQSDISWSLDKLEFPEGLIIGESYEVTVNGVTRTYECFEDDGSPTLGYSNEIIDLGTPGKWKIRMGTSSDGDNYIDAIMNLCVGDTATIIISSIEFTLENDALEVDIYWSDDVEYPEELIIGESYEVTVNGVTGTYECFEDDGYPTLGYKYDEITELHEYGMWQIYVYDEDDTNFIYAGMNLRVGETATFIVKHATHEDHRIDAKYLPEGGVGWTERVNTVVFDNIEGDVFDSGDDIRTDFLPIIDVDFESIYDKFTNGANITVTVNGVPYTNTMVTKEGNYVDIKFWEEGSSGSDAGELHSSITNGWVIYDSWDTKIAPIGLATFGLSIEEDVVHKINEKYLPVIPAAPSNDGTYTLTCTVTDGEPAYSWESTQNESDDMWQSITEYIDEKLGAIENGSY